MNEPHDTPTVVTVEAAAKRLSIGRTTTFALVASGELASIQVGRRRLVPVAAIDHFVADRLAHQSRSSRGSAA